MIGQRVSYYHTLEKFGEGRRGFLYKAEATKLKPIVYAVKAHGPLAAAYENSGLYRNAIEKCEESLDIRKNVDPGIKEICIAQQRLAKLKRMKERPKLTQTDPNSSIFLLLLLLERFLSDFETPVLTCRRNLYYEYSLIIHQIIE